MLEPIHYLRQESRVRVGNSPEVAIDQCARVIGASKNIVEYRDIHLSEASWLQFCFQLLR